MHIKKKIKLVFIFLPLILIIPLIIGTSISQYSNISIDARFNDWTELQKISDPTGDATSGNPDDEILFALAGGNVLYIFDNQNGNYINIYNITAAREVYASAVGDINGDGKNEIAITSNNGYNNILKFFKNVNGTWIEYYNYGGICESSTTDYSQHLAIENIDDDVNLEVVYACGKISSNGEIRVFEEISGTVTSEKIADVDWSSHYILVIGNLDNDDYPEIFISDETYDQFRVFEYDGSAYPQTATLGYGTGMSVADMGVIGDADLDNIDDLIVCGNSQRVHVIDALGNNNYRIVWESDQVGSFTQACGIGDLNGNGKPEIIAAGSGSPAIMGYYEKVNNVLDDYSYNNTWNYVTTGINVHAGGTGDFDSDGRIEWAFEDIDTKVSDNNTAPFGPPFEMTTISSLRPFRMSIGDVDNDGGTGGINQENHDIKIISLANDDTDLYALVEVNGIIDVSGNSYYRLFISTDTLGNDITPDTQEILPIKYNYIIKIENSQCNVYNYNNPFVPVSSCEFASNYTQLEIGITLLDINVGLNDDIDVIFETGNASSRYDLATDFPDFIDYHVSDGTLPDCGDGYCDGSAGEDCNTCFLDCIGGEFSICGDGICHGQANGEDCNTCPGDCFSETLTQGTCAACWKGVCDGSCNTRKEDSTCRDCNTPITTCCGDGVCEGNEDFLNCAVDCDGNLDPLLTYCCGDGVCEGDEDVNNCMDDCGCTLNEECDDSDECTTDVCTGGVCQNTPVSDGTLCSGGICCGGSCTIPVCTIGSECGDGEACTTDTCINPGTCSSSCTNTWPSCGIGDGCCGPGCGSEDPDCTVDCSTCWKEVCDGSCNPAKEGPSCPDCV